MRLLGDGHERNAIAKEGVQEHDELEVDDDDDADGQQENEEEDGHVVAGHGHRAFGPLDRAGGARRLHGVVRPADERHEGPEEREHAAREHDVQAVVDGEAARQQRLVHREQLVHGDHDHQIHAQAAYEVHEKGTNRAAQLLERPPVPFSSASDPIKKQRTFIYTYIM